MLDDPLMESTINYNFNHIHKRFMVLYDLSDMRKVWQKVRSSWKKETKQKLPKRFKKQPQTWLDLNLWIENKIVEFVKNGGEDIIYLNKSDLITQGWDNKLIAILYPKPEKVVYLGRGRWAYYYNAAKVGDLEDSEDFIYYISQKIERKRKREANLAFKLGLKRNESVGF